MYICMYIAPMDHTPDCPDENLADQVGQPIGDQESVSTIQTQTNRQSKITGIAIILLFCLQLYTYVCTYVCILLLYGII